MTLVGYNYEFLYHAYNYFYNYLIHAGTIGALSHKQIKWS